jgi:hypothetical protein
MSDLATRISAGETFAELLPDFHYGLLAELEECLYRILAKAQLITEDTMNSQIGNNNSSEPTKILSLHNCEGIFFIFILRAYIQIF